MIKLFYSSVFSFLFICIFSACENDIEEVNSLSIDTLYPDQSAKNVSIVYSQNGKSTLQLDAPVLNQYGGEEPYNEMPQGVHVIVFDSNRNVSSELTSNYAIERSYNGTMEAKNDVVVVNEKGEQLNTEHLVWNQKTGEITSDVFVKITTKEQIIMGDGLISNQDFTDYKILKPRGIINIDNDKMD